MPRVYDFLCEECGQPARSNEPCEFCSHEPKVNDETDPDPTPYTKAHHAPPSDPDQADDDPDDTDTALERDPGPGDGRDEAHGPAD